MAENYDSLQTLRQNKSNQDVLDVLKRHFLSRNIDDDVIESVAFGCNFDLELSRSNLIEMFGDDNDEINGDEVIVEKIPPLLQNGVVQNRGNPQSSQDISAMVGLTPADKAIASAKKGNLVLVILRGLPGSGKSTLARKIVAESIGPCNPRDFILSADDYFYQNPTGNYHYNSASLGDAHAWNQQRTYNAMKRGMSPIVIDNTNTQIWEMKYYCATGVNYGYTVHVLEPGTTWAFNEHELYRRNTHNVPKDKIVGMMERYERNITVEKIFKAFDLRYTRVKPPQLRKFPPIKEEAPAKAASFYPFHDKKYNFTKDSRDNWPTSTNNIPNLRNNVFRVDKVNAATCTRDRNGQHTLIQSQGSFVNYGQLPVNYPREGFYDKSTSTEEEDSNMETETPMDQAIESLGNLFEKIPREYLKDVLEKCQGHVDWAAELLLEDSKEFVENYEAPKPTPKARETTATITSGSVIFEDEDVTFVTPGNNDAQELKKHLESNFVMNPQLYSNHVRKLKGYVDDPLPTSSSDDDAVPGTSGLSKKPQDKDAFVFVDSDMEFDDCDDVIELSDNESDQGDHDMVELNIGDQFASQLNQIFGDSDMTFPGGFEPVVEIPKALGQQLYALYLESMFKQLDYQQAVIAKTIKEDEQFAQTLQDEEYRKLDEEPDPPDFKQIMKDQQEAQRVQKQAESEWRNLTPDDLAYKMTKQKLIATFPQVEADVLTEILAAHENRYDETVASLRESGAEYQENIKKIISPGTLDEMRTAHEAAAIPTVTLSDLQNNSSQYLRQEAVNYQRRRNELQDKAKQYYSRGMHEVAVFYSDLASKQTQMWEKYNNMAANRIVSESFKQINNLDTIDLHHLHVPEALNALDIFIDQIIDKLQHSSGKGFHFVHVITGRGKNSPQGIARIRPCVQGRLGKRKLRYQLVNPGLLKVKILRHSLTSAQFN